MAVTRHGFREAKERARRMGAVSEREMITRLSHLGERLCAHARNTTPSRDTGGYDDQTGNLRSSIGYRIFKDGEPVKEGGFQQVKGGTEGLGAAHAALAALPSTVEVEGTGWSLVIVAGMSYAQAVESRGYNVLHLTEEKLADGMRDIKRRLHL